jgi:hypothetical protein
MRQCTESDVGTRLNVCKGSEEDRQTVDRSARFRPRLGEPAADLRVDVGLRPELEVAVESSGNRLNNLFPAWRHIAVPDLPHRSLKSIEGETGLPPSAEEFVQLDRRRGHHSTTKRQSRPDRTSARVTGKGQRSS